MAESVVGNGIKQEKSPHFHDIYNGLHAQLSAEDTRNVDKNDSADESGDSPLDFSIKPKSRNYQDEISGSDSISSPASSNNDTPGNVNYRKQDYDERVSYFNGSVSNQESPENFSATFASQLRRNKDRRRVSRELSPGRQIGEPRTAEPNGAILPGMLHSLQMGLIPNVNMLASTFPSMAGLVDPHNGSSVSKSSRPFKAYPKDPLSLPVGSMANPQYLSSFANFENSGLSQGLNVNSEEIFSIYKQQLMLLREREKYLESMKLSQHSARTNTVMSTPRSSIVSSPSHYNNNNINKNKGVSNNNNNHNIDGFCGLTNTASSSASSTPVSNSEQQLTVSGRRRPRSLPDEQKDELYWERRRKNNEAAKRSRDTRRAKEDEIAIRAALLEQENLKLRVEVAALKTETAKLRCMLYNS